MRVLVTGSRQLLEQTQLYEALDFLYSEWVNQFGIYHEESEFVVVHGGAPGADTLAGQWCHDRRNCKGIVQEVHAARWGKFGKLAGGIRNQEMVNAGADIVLAFFVAGAKNVGTRNCVTTAHLAGLDVQEFWA